jgi:voltage-dependent anion channel protein 2
LLGGKEGVFQYNQVVSISSKTVDGVEFTATTAKRDDKVETALKAGYKYKNIQTNVTFNHLGKVVASATVSDIAPGLSATILGTLPDVHTAKLGIDYTLPHLTLKSTVGLTAAPAVDISATSGYNDVVFGGLATFDTAKNNSLTKWTLGVGYTRLDYQVAALLADQGETLKVQYAHNVDPTQSVGGEVSKSLHKDDATLITLGYLKRLQNGSLAKVRLDNTGIASFLYEQELQPKTKLALASQFDATNLEKAPKIGIALDIKN